MVHRHGGSRNDGDCVGVSFQDLVTSKTDGQQNKEPRQEPPSRSDLILSSGIEKSRQQNASDYEDDLCELFLNHINNVGTTNYDQSTSTNYQLPTTN